MGVTVFYSGKLAEGKSAEQLLSYLKELADRRNFRLDEVYKTFQFRIPQDVVDNPDGIFWSYRNEERIKKYAEEAKIRTKDKSYRELCEELNSTNFRQMGAYLWTFKNAEP